MEMKMRLNRLKHLVYSILKDNPKTRDSDRLLYNEVCMELGYDTHTISAYEMLHSSTMPSIESVGRARRKAQEEHPELRASAGVQQRRAELYSDYLQFARGF